MLIFSASTTLFYFRKEKRDDQRIWKILIQTNSEKNQRIFYRATGEKEALNLMAAMKNREWIIISGPRVATGKTTLADILYAIGYTRVIEEWQTKTILVCNPLAELREKREIFESLGISGKC